MPAQGCYIVRFAQGAIGTAACVPRFLCGAPGLPYTDLVRRLTHDLVLPVWKSNVSVTLMIEKKAKR